MIIVRIVQFVKILQLVQLDYYGYIKFFGAFVSTWVGSFTAKTTHSKTVELTQISHSEISDYDK